jgi:hypothetical protein
VIVNVEFTREELAALIDLEEEFLCLSKGWKIGDPHPLGPVADAASEKIREER